MKAHWDDYQFAAEKRAADIRRSGFHGVMSSESCPTKPSGDIDSGMQELCVGIASHFICHEVEYNVCSDGIRPLS